MYVKRLKDDEILQIMRVISDPDCEIVSIFRKVTDPEVVKHGTFRGIHQ